MPSDFLRTYLEAWSSASSHRSMRNLECRHHSCTHLQAPIVWSNIVAHGSQKTYIPHRRPVNMIEGTIRQCLEFLKFVLPSTALRNNQNGEYVGDKDSQLFCVEPSQRPCITVTACEGRKNLFAFDCVQDTRVPQTIIDECLPPSVWSRCIPQIQELQSLLSHLHSVKGDLELGNISQHQREAVTSGLPCKRRNRLLLLHGLHGDQRFPNAEYLEVVVLQRQSVTCGFQQNTIRAGLSAEKRSVEKSSSGEDD